MKEKKSIKKIGGILLLILVIGMVIFIFVKKDNKEPKNGNTISNPSKEQMLEYILNITSYEAKATVEVSSNKKQNKYVLSQKQEGTKYVQEVLEPSNIQGLKTIYDGTNLKIENTKLNLSTIYENYPYLAENNLWLSSFLREYKESEDSICEEKGIEWILSTKKKKDTNSYEVTKKLSVDKKTGKPTKLEVQDMNQKTLVYILYNEIEINSLKGKDILAFQKGIIKKQI